MNDLEHMAWKNYMADACLMILRTEYARAGVEDANFMRFADLIEPPEDANAEEIISGVVEKSGLVLIDD